MKINALVFDLGGVILEDHFAIAAEKIAALYNLDTQQLIKTFKKHDSDIYHSGKASYEMRWQVVLKELDRQDIDIATLTKIHESIFQPVPKMVELIYELANEFPLYILSNQVASILPKLVKKYDFFKVFKYSVFSYQVGLAKPHPEIYQYFIDHTNIKPPEAIFIDNQQDNIDTAQQLGFQTILFKNHDQFMVDLKNLAD
jgi:HAD superfamily hydrolase (TIGR01509 family)